MYAALNLLSFSPQVMSRFIEKKNNNTMWKKPASTYCMFNNSNRVCWWPQAGCWESKIQWRLTFAICPALLNTTSHRLLEGRALKAFSPNGLSGTSEDLHYILLSRKVVEVTAKGSYGKRKAATVLRFLHYHLIYKNMFYIWWLTATLCSCFCFLHLLM